MRQRLQILPIAVMAACMLLVLGSVRFVSPQKAPKQETAFGRFKREQILARSEPLLQTLLQGSTILNSNLSTNRSYRTSGNATPIWMVDYLDPAVRNNARIVWDAKSGELLYASQWKTRAPSPPVDAPTTRNEALALTWDWFHALPLRQDHEAWRVVATQQNKCAQWKIQLQGGERVADFIVNTATGQLVQMTCSHLSDPKIDRNAVALQSDPLR